MVLVRACVGGGWWVVVVVVTVGVPRAAGKPSATVGPGAMEGEVGFGASERPVGRHRAVG